MSKPDAYEAELYETELDALIAEIERQAEIRENPLLDADTRENATRKALEIVAIYCGRVQRQAGLDPNAELAADEARRFCEDYANRWDTLSYTEREDASVHVYALLLAMPQ